MVKVDDYEQIRKAYHIEGLSIREISRRYNHSAPNFLDAGLLLRQHLACSVNPWVVLMPGDFSKDAS